VEVDQIGRIVEILKKDPMSRRMVVTAWEPGNALSSKLPPCHYTFAFNVQENRLNCHLTQRSGDIALGIPFNLACYSLLTQILAQEAGLELGEFSHMIIDAHVYVNHVDGLREQLTRAPRPLSELPRGSLPELDATQAIAVLPIENATQRDLRLQSANPLRDLPRAIGDPFAPPPATVR